MHNNCTALSTITARALATGGSLIALLVGGEGALAQAIAPAPANQQTAGAFAVPAAPGGKEEAPAPPAPARPAGPQTQPLISLRFQDAPVAEIVRMIAEQGNVQIMITGDVDMKLKYVNLENLTPQAAIEQVAHAAGLGSKKLADGTYVIAAKLPPDPPRGDAPAGALPGPAFGLQPATNNYGGGPTAISAAETYPALRPMGTGGGASEEGEKIYQYFKIKNLKPSIITWTLDPVHNQMPLEYRISDRNQKRMTREGVAIPAVAPEVMQAMRGLGPAPSSNTTYGPSGLGGAVTDNGSQEGGYGQFTPYTTANMQFGQRGGAQGAGQRGGQRGGQGGRGGGGAFALPEGIESAVAVDPQNAILVYGTEAGVRKLQTIISYLDKPLQQVEIEAQFVTLNTNDTRQIGIDFQSNNGPFTTNLTGQAPAPTAGAFTLGYVRNNFQARLNALISRSRAKVVNAPRVLAINNLTASIESEVQTPIILTTVTTGIGGQQSQGQDLLYIPTSIGLEVTPTINNDGTITVVMSPQVETSNPDVRTGNPVISSQTIFTTANVRDGDTIALGGLRSSNISRGGSRIPVLSRLPLLGQFFRSNARIESDNDLIIFLTARIVHRLEENAPLPGT